MPLAYYHFFQSIYNNVCLIFIKLSAVTSDLFHKLAANQLLQAEFGQNVYNIKQVNIC
jgi:hypothetical protein